MYVAEYLNFFFGDVNGERGVDWCRGDGETTEGENKRTRRKARVNSSGD